MTPEQINEAIEESRPVWVTTKNLKREDIEDIQQGGCSSGAYMPAVTYYQARETMAEHGDAVLEYIEEAYGEMPTPDDGESWSGITVFYLSCAVECWASSFDFDDMDICEECNESNREYAVCDDSGDQIDGKTCCGCGY